MRELDPAAVRGNLLGLEVALLFFSVKYSVFQYRYILGKCIDRPIFCRSHVVRGANDKCRFAGCTKLY